MTNTFDRLAPLFFRWCIKVFMHQPSPQPQTLYSRKYEWRSILIINLKKRNFSFSLSIYLSLSLFFQSFVFSINCGTALDALDCDTASIVWLLVNMAVWNKEQNIVIINKIFHNNHEFQIRFHFSTQIEMLWKWFNFSFIYLSFDTYFLFKN